MALFGTDGVRGRASNIEVSDPLLEYSENRVFSKELCGEIGYCASLLSGPGEVVIGWDRRPFNLEMATYLAGRLSMHKGGISFLGETSTPALQHEMTSRGAALGIMITASHNPSYDSGVKLFLGNGRKLTKPEEAKIEAMMFRGRSEPHSIPYISENMCNSYLSFISSEIQACARRGFFPQEEILIDGSGGWISTWLVDLMTSHGINCREVSDKSASINHNSGAGSLKEGRLTWDECRVSNHALLRQVRPSPKGHIIGFCFDGDGDRCFMVCSDGDMVIVVGGDGFLRLFLNSRKKDSSFTVSLTIESSLDLSETIGKFSSGKLIETGVGDRWLQHALISDQSESQVGSEPSGHVVLKHTWRDKYGYWGDGVVTMFEFLKLIHTCGPQWIKIVSTSKSHILSESIYPSNRSLWDPNGKTGDLVRVLIASFFNIEIKDIIEINNLNDADLLFLRVKNQQEWSVAIRNSGTEEKTRVTIRTTSENDGEASRLLIELVRLLGPILSS